MQDCSDAIQRIDNITTVINIVGTVISLYVTLRVHSATGSMWKAFATFALLSCITGFVVLAFVESAIRRDPCVKKALLFE
jgi:hypothetical protein